MSSAKPKVYVLLLRQDDPKKCTSVKLAKFRLATPLYRMGRVPRRSLVLNPAAPRILLPGDRRLAEEYGLVAVDCSWERAQEVFARRLPGLGRRLPVLLAGNPVNYAKPHKLSSAEALAAALYVIGFRQRAVELLSIFKWGEGFLALNREPLESYMSVKDEDEMIVAEGQFF